MAVAAPEAAGVVPKNLRSSAASPLLLSGALSWFAITLSTPPWRLWRSTTPTSRAVCNRHQILTLHKAGHSNREIAALLGVNRETVGKHLVRAKAQNQPSAPTGTEGDAGTAAPDQPNAPTGSASSPANGPPSECEAFREEILAKIA